MRRITGTKTSLPVAMGDYPGGTVLRDVADVDGSGGKDRRPSTTTQKRIIYAQMLLFVSVLSFVFKISNPIC